MLEPVPQLPQDVDAEEQVLGAMLLDPAQVPVVCSILDPTDFYHAQHQRLFSVIRERFERGEPIDALLVARLAEMDPVAVRDMEAATALPRNASAHACSVKEASQRRQLIHIVTDVRELALDGERTATDVLSELGSRVEALSDAVPASEPKVLDLAGLIANGIPSPEWLIPGWLMAGDVALLAGAAGIGKSTVAADMAIALSRGDVWAGTALSRAVPVLYVDEEQGVEETCRCFARLIRGDVPTGLQVASSQRLRLDTPAGHRRLRNLVVRTEARVAILDSAQQIFGEIDENSASEVGRAYKVLFDLRDELGVTWVLIHHKKKQQRGGPSGGLEMVRGSSAHGTQASTVWFAWSAGTTRLNVRQEKRRGGTKTSIVLEYSEDESGAVHILGAGSVDDDDTELERVSEWVCQLVDGAEKPLWTRDIKMAGASDGLKDRTIERALKYLVRIGRLEKPRRGLYQPASEGGNVSE
jgi:hypothetical protein